MYEIFIDEENEKLGVNFISLVEKPAIGIDYVKFYSSLQKFSIDNDRQIVTGAAMVPNLNIYRNDSALGEYYTFYSAATVEAIAQKFMREGKTLNLNLEHADQYPKNSYIYESWISDSKRGVLPLKGFEHLPDGTWFVSMHIQDSHVWDLIKKDKLKGFSIEGFLGHAPVAHSSDEILLNEIKKLLGV